MSVFGNMVTVSYVSLISIKLLATNVINQR